MKNNTLFLLLSLVVSTTAFQAQLPSSRDATTKALLLEMAHKGSSGGGFGASTKEGGAKKKASKSDIKKVQKRVEKKYGKDIARGTQKRVEDAMNGLPPHLYMATQLYQQLKKYKVKLNQMTVLQQAQLSEPEVDAARGAQTELDRLCKEHDLTEHDLHNIFQQITWDASADAKAARAITGDMPAVIQAKIDKACQIAASAVMAAGDNNGKLLDIGCGFGVLVPQLLECNVSPSQIYGIDLSSEMIRNGEEQHPGVNFEAVDFMNDYNPEEGFDAVIFCSALHDFSDIEAALQKAASLVRPKGKLIIAHAQGASHVQKQVNANPILVQRGLPSAEELHSLNLDGMTLESEPVKSNAPEEAKEGYLAVLTKS